MDYFEPYQEKNDRSRPSLTAACMIRLALPTDGVELGEIEATREGGSAAERSASIRRALTEWSATGEGMIVVAQMERRLLYRSAGTKESERA